MYDYYLFEMKSNAIINDRTLAISMQKPAITIQICNLIDCV